MSGKAIFSIIMIVFWSVMLAWSLSNYFAASEDLKVAQEDYKNAVAEKEQAQRKLDAVIDEHIRGGSN